MLPKSSTPWRHPMNNNLPSELASSFNQPRLDALVEGLDLAYDHLPSRDEVPGFDNTLVGQSLYRLPRHWLLETAGELGVKLADENNNALLYQVGGEVFSCQRVASTAMDIRGAFPGSYKACLQYYREYRKGQGVFDFMENDYGGNPPLVLAHMGNQRDGLLAVYLCRPSVVVDGNVRAWEFAYEVLGASVERKVMLSGEQVPAVEQVEEPLVRPRRERRQGPGA